MIQLKKDGVRSVIGLVLVGLLSTSLLACGNGGASSATSTGSSNITPTPTPPVTTPTTPTPTTPTATTNPAAGIYSGTIKNGIGTSYDYAGLVSPNSRVFLFATAGNVIYTGDNGSFDPTSTGFEGVLDYYTVTKANSYSLKGSETISYVFSATTTPRVQISGTIGSNTLQLQFASAASDIGASLTALAGQYTVSDTTTGENMNMTITSAGALSATDSAACVYAAKVTAPASTVDVYELDDVLVTCPGQASISAKGVLTANAYTTTFAFYNQNVAQLFTLIKAAAK